jgi:uncharacterized protein YcaQ
MPEPAERDAIRELVRRSARALGIASESDLRDYFRLPAAEARTAVRELVESGEIQPVTVEGWRMVGYLHRDAVIPTRSFGTALLAPFDPLVWERGRTERLFGFRYRIEIYTPQNQRQFGYYVLPFLMDGQFAGRVCLKADRQSGRLRVNASYHEAGIDEAAVAERLAGELLKMAGWLSLSDVLVASSGTLAWHLHEAVLRRRA